jgi:hypothetical protein
VHVGRVVVGVCAALLLFTSSAAADDWLPHSSDATWTYQWTDSVYNTSPTKEAVTVQSTKGTSFVLAWTTDGQGNPDDAPDSTGTVSFQETTSGLINTDWSSNAPPQAFPILCASPVRCGNSLASTYYNVIWGGRVPVLSEPLLKGASWTSSGGAGNDVASTSRYLGTEDITVPAFDHPVTASIVRSDITQAGAYGFTLRNDGVTNIWGTTQAAILPKYKFPALGPNSLPKSKRRHFFTPFDLMDYGFNPLFPAYPQATNNWDGAASGRDFQVYGVTGRAQILGIETVKVPAGTFEALAVRTTLNQAGYKFGSGTRTSWFAPNKGLVKLVFKHADRSTSTVVLVK